MNFISKIKRLFKHIYVMPANNVSRIKFLFAWEYGFLRFVYFFITKKLRTFNEIDNATGIGGAKYSKKAFYDGKIPVYRPNERVMWPIFFLNSIPLINKNDLLVIGPRYETEILIAKSFGFRNIIGLDTYSYSPLIEMGDMHNMRFEDNSFNNVICASTLTYSDNPKLAAKEMIRVMRKNAIVVIMVHAVSTYKDFDKSKGIEGQNYDKDRPDTKENLDKLFDGLEKVHFIEVDETNGSGGAILIAAYKKIN